LCLSSCKNNEISDTYINNIHPIFDVLHDNSTLKFIAVGDTGTADEQQARVAQAMAQKCASAGCDFVILLGDNFYPSGVNDVDDPLFQSAFEVPYVNLPVPFYPILGNHDARGNTQAQIDYSAKSAKWVMPGSYYGHRHSNTKPLITFIAADSNNFDSAQAQWVKDVLAQDESPWRLLYLHHPLFSNGWHGEDDAGIVDQMIPLICGKIDFVLGGHDHTKEHLIGTHNGCSIHQIVLGTGGRDLYDINPDERTLFGISSHGFGWFQVTAHELYFEFINTDGLVEYSYTVSK